MNSVKSSKKRACHWIKRQTARLGEGSIRYSIFIYFTITALVAIIIIGFSLYTRFSDQLTDEVQKENQILMNQVSRSVDSYLRGMMKLSDAIYYSVVKNTDISVFSFFMM